MAVPSRTPMKAYSRLVGSARWRIRSSVRRRRPSQDPLEDADRQADAQADVEQVPATDRTMAMIALRIGAGCPGRRRCPEEEHRPRNRPADPLDQHDVGQERRRSAGRGSASRCRDRDRRPRRLPAHPATPQNVDSQQDRAQDQQRRRPVGTALGSIGPRVCGGLGDPRGVDHGTSRRGPGAEGPLRARSGPAPSALVFGGHQARAPVRAAPRPPARPRLRGTSRTRRRRGRRRSSPVLLERCLPLAASRASW